jgi:hypothetical protein
MEREYYFRTVCAGTKGEKNCDRILKVTTGINICETLRSLDVVRRESSDLQCRLVNIQKINSSETSVDMYQTLRLFKLIF